MNIYTHTHTHKKLHNKLYIYAHIIKYTMQHYSNYLQIEVFQLICLNTMNHII